MDLIPLRMLDSVAISSKSPVVSVTAIENDSHEKSFVPRKPHTKSRGGCLSCKRRRQKCDEAKPSCSRCERLCFTCEYKSVSKKAQNTPLAASPTADEEIPRTLDRMLACPPPNEMSVTSLVDTIFEDALDRPRNVRVQTQSISQLLHIWLNTGFVEFKPFGDIQMQRVYRTDSIRLALSRPYLLHCLMAIATIQRKCCETPWDQLPTHESTWYWQHGLAQFHRRLQAPVTADEDAAALVSTSAFINGCSFAFIHTMNPAEAWPNVVRHDSLSWLKVITGPQLMLKQLRSHLHLDDQPAPAAAVAEKLLTAKELKEKGVKGIPLVMQELFELDDESTPQNNVYHGVCRVVAPHLDTFEEYEGKPDAGVYFKFMAVYDPLYTKLLEERDERALLLLCLWYSCLMGDIWWNGVRAHVEGRAICMYLERRTKDARIRQLLEWPAKKLGYALKPIGADEATLACAIPDDCCVM